MIKAPGIRAFGAGATMWLDTAMEVYGGISLVCFLLEESIQALAISARTAAKEGDAEMELLARRHLERTAQTIRDLAGILTLWPGGPNQAWAAYAAAASRRYGLARVQPFAPKEETAKVKRAVDGDTLETEDGRKVRLWGINAPELDTDAGKASQAALALLTVDYEARLVLVGDALDIYGRRVRKVYVGEADIGALMIAGGWAEPYTYHGIAASPEKLATLRARR